VLSILQRCAEGDETLQAELLDEVEPLIFGYVRSLLPATDDSFARAVALTHAATLGFLLEVRTGRVRLATEKALRGHCHRLALAKLRDADPLLLTAEGDEETGGLTPHATEVANAFERALDPPLLRAAALRLLGMDSPKWDEAAPILQRAGLVRVGGSERDA